jgi:RNA polymerase sigma factor (sigma-70 family)
MIDKKWIEGLQTNNPEVISALYQEHKSAFIAFLGRYPLSEVERQEIFHDALMVLKKQAVRGQLQEIKYSLKTYLYAIGKHKAIDLLKKNARSPIWVEDGIPDVAVEDYSTQEESSGRQSQIKIAFEKLGKSCQKVLTMFYLQGLSITEIKEKGGYENENTVRAQKSRCLKSLKDLITKPKK